MVEDALGRQTHLSFDGLDRLIAVTDALQGESTFVYDDRDNLTAVTDAAGATTHYEYDGLNNLIASLGTKKSDKSDKGKDKSKKKNKGTVTDDNLHVKSNHKQVKEKLHFHYDQLGNLIAESTFKGQVVREYIYLGNYRIALLAEKIDTKPKKDKSKKSKKDKDKSKKHSDKDDDPKKQKTRLKLYFLHNDHLGTTRKVTDSKQRVVWSSAQTPFGEMVVDIEGLRMPMRFPGQYADLESGYSYNYFRDYDPSLGRYIQSDPIGLLAGVNLYTYAGNDSVSSTDMLGLCPWCIAGAAGALIGGTANAAGTYLSGGSSGDIAAAFFVGATAGAVFGATGGAAGGVGVWIASGSVSGAITGAGTTAINRGSVDEIILSGTIGAAAGGIAGGVGHSVAVPTAVAFLKQGVTKNSSILTADILGQLGSAITSIGILSRSEARVPEC